MLHCCLQATQPPTANQSDLPGHWKCPLGWGCDVGGCYMPNYTPRREVGWGFEVARLRSQGTSPKYMLIAGCIYGQPNYTVAAFVLWGPQGWPNATRAIQNLAVGLVPYRTVPGLRKRGLIPRHGHGPRILDLPVPGLPRGTFFIHHNTPKAPAAKEAPGCRSNAQKPAEPHGYKQQVYTACAGAVQGEAPFYSRIDHRLLVGPAASDVASPVFYAGSKGPAGRSGRSAADEPG